VASITVVEIDPVVVSACRQHFPAMAAALDDPRVDLVIGDGLAHLASQKGQAYDLIIVDAGGTSGPGSPLITAAFYEGARKRLAEGGILCAQTPRPTLDSESFRHALFNQRAAFGAGSVSCYLAFIPSFTTGLVSFSLASETALRPRGSAESDRAQAFAVAHPLQYYTPDIHRSAFALPAFVQAMLSDTP
jgi:spermidine synthase